MSCSDAFNKALNKRDKFWILATSKACLRCRQDFRAFPLGLQMELASISVWLTSQATNALLSVRCLFFVLHLMQPGRSKQVLQQFCNSAGSKHLLVLVLICFLRNVVPQAFDSIGLPNRSGIPYIHNMRHGMYSTSCREHSACPGLWHRTIGSIDRIPLTEPRTANNLAKTMMWK